MAEQIARSKPFRLEAQSSGADTTEYRLYENGTLAQTVLLKDGASDRIVFPFPQGKPAGTYLFRVVGANEMELGEFMDLELIVRGQPAPIMSVTLVVE
jgi:hypothetical protein